MRGECIVGITAPGSPTVLEHGYKTDGYESEEALTLDSNQADRLVDFYERCRVAPPERTPFYNCHLLAWYTLGKVNDLLAYDNYRVSQIDDAHSTQLEAGQAYMIQVDTSYHSLLGINRPDYNLSILGDRSPLAISKNAELLSLYEGTRIQHIQPR